MQFKGMHLPTRHSLCCVLAWHLTVICKCIMSWLPFIHFHFCSETGADWALQNGQSFTSKSGEMKRSKNQNNKKPKTKPNPSTIDNSIHIIFILSHYQLGLQEDNNKCHIPICFFFSLHLCCKGTLFCPR